MTDQVNDESLDELLDDKLDNKRIIKAKIISKKRGEPNPFTEDE
jgi:hypothetical protein